MGMEWKLWLAHARRVMSQGTKDLDGNTGDDGPDIFVLFKW
jgi:hypothetical protein